MVGSDRSSLCGCHCPQKSLYVRPELGWWRDLFISQNSAFLCGVYRPVLRTRLAVSVEMGRLRLLSSASIQSRYQVSRFTDMLSYSNRAFLEPASACVTCRSNFAPVLACRAPSHTPPSHMPRELVKPADIPKWVVRDSGASDPASAPQCALPSPA